MQFDHKDINSFKPCVPLMGHRQTAYEGEPRSNANSCVISFTIAIFQDSLNNDALSSFPDPITILTESHSNPRCLATRECKVNDIGHG